MTVIYRDILKPKYGNQKKFAAAAEKFARRHKINVDFKSQSFVSHLHTCQSLISKEHVALYSGMSGVPTGDIDPNRVTSLTQPKILVVPPMDTYFTFSHREKLPKTGGVIPRSGLPKTFANGLKKRGDRLISIYISMLIGIWVSVLRSKWRIRLLLS